MSRVVAIAFTAVLISSSAWADASGSLPRDEAMTCEQIGIALAPYAQQLRPATDAMAASGQEVQRRMAERMAAAQAQTAASTAANIAAAAVPVAGSAVAAAQVAAQQAQIQAQMAEDAPLRAQIQSQGADLAAQAQQMQADPRFNRLMQLAEEKNCH